MGISGHLYEYVDEIHLKVFHEECDKKDVHQFALAAGIAADRRLPRSEFKAEGDHPEVNPGSQLATHDGIKGIITLISLQGGLGESKPSEVVSEYINGGLEFLREISFEDQDDESTARFLEEFPHLSDEEESD